MVQYVATVEIAIEVPDNLDPKDRSGWVADAISEALTHNLEYEGVIDGWQYKPDGMGGFMYASHRTLSG